MSDPSMALPAGKTCSSCAHFRRCGMLFGCSPSATTCDWAPSRFVEKAPAPPPGRASAYVSPIWPPPGDLRAAHQVVPGTQTCAPTCPCKEASRG